MRLIPCICFQFSDLFNRYLVNSIINELVSCTFAYTLYELNTFSHSSISLGYFNVKVERLYSSPRSLGNDGCNVLGINCSKYGSTIFNIAGLVFAVFNFLKKSFWSSSGVCSNRGCLLDDDVD